MSKIDAIISRKRSSSPCQSGKRSRISPSLSASKNGDQLRPQFMLMNTPLNFSTSNRSPNTQQGIVKEESLNFMNAIPRPAPANQRTAPVHIDVGGMSYTSTLETLTKYPDSYLAKLFNGTVPVVLDSLKQTYFLDRDGPSFRHILNFLRNGEFILPEDFQALDILEAEARYFALDDMIESIAQFRQRKAMNDSNANLQRSSTHVEIVIVHMERDNPNLDPGSSREDMLYLSGSADILKDIFPEFGAQNEQSNAKEINTKCYVEKVKLSKPVTLVESLRRFAEQDFTVYSTSILNFAHSNRHTMEYVLCKK